MKITKRGDYALRAAIYIASQPPGKIVELSDISDSQSIPRSFLAKIMQQMVKAGIIESHMGINGGFSLAKPAGDVSFYDVLKAAEGPVNINACLDEDGSCAFENRCSIHSFLESLQDDMKTKMKSQTLADMLAK
jgi:Rrf2 family protein